MSTFLAGLSGIGLLTALQVVLVVVAVVVAPRGRRPSSALAWILLITLLPLVGVVLFALIGSSRLPSSRRDKQQHMNDRIEEGSRDLEEVSRTKEGPPWLPSVARLNQTVGAMPLLEGNHAQLLTCFEDQLSALVAAVEGARRYVHVEFYILLLDSSTAPFFAVDARSWADRVRADLRRRRASIRNRGSAQPRRAPARASDIHERARRPRAPARKRRDQARRRGLRLISDAASGCPAVSH